MVSLRSLKYKAYQILNRSNYPHYHRLPTARSPNPFPDVRKPCAQGETPKTYCLHSTPALPSVAHMDRALSHSYFRPFLAHFFRICHWRGNRPILTLLCQHYWGPVAGHQIPRDPHRRQPPQDRSTNNHRTFIRRRNRSRIARRPAGDFGAVLYFHRRIQAVIVVWSAEHFPNR